MGFILIVGTRPNFVKAAPVIRELTKRKIPYYLIHTGQHYDANMSDIFFGELNIPVPQIIFSDYKPFNEVDHFSNIMKTLAYHLSSSPFGIKNPKIIVFGDVNSSLAGALVASKLGYELIHYESGERHRTDKDLKDSPEQTNRKMIEILADHLLCASEQGIDFSDNSTREKQVHLVGNLMADQALHSLKFGKFAVRKEHYALLTIHRQELVDSEKELRKMVSIMLDVSDKIPVYFPMHPRTRKQFKKFNFLTGTSISNIHIIEPMGYLAFLHMLDSAKFVMTDSGGVQVEASVLDIPCITLRESTEWHDTLNYGTNMVAGNIDDDILRLVDIALNHWPYKKNHDYMPWDGSAAKRMVDYLEQI